MTVCAKEFADFRSWLGMTQEEFAVALGVARETVARWEGATTVPPAWVADAVLTLNWRPEGGKHSAKWIDGQAIGKAVWASVCDAEVARKWRRRPGPHSRYLVLLAALDGRGAFPVAAVSMGLLGAEEMRRSLGGQKSAC